MCTSAYIYIHHVHFYPYGPSNVTEHLLLHMTTMNWTLRLHSQMAWPWPSSPSPLPALLDSRASYQICYVVLCCAVLCCATLKYDIRGSLTREQTAVTSQTLTALLQAVKAVALPTSGLGSKVLQFLFKQKPSIVSAWVVTYLLLLFDRKCEIQMTLESSNNKHSRRPECY